MATTKQKRERAVRNAAHAGPPRLDLFDQQRRFVDDLSPICVAVTGIGGSKTVSGAVKVLHAIDAFPGLRVLVTAPTFTQLEQGTIRALIDRLDPRRIEAFNKNDHLITLVNGAEIYYQSADNYDHFRGPEFGVVWMDEAAYCVKEAYLVMMGRLRQPVTPTHQPLQAIITTTPAGLNWVYDQFDNPPRLKGEFFPTGEYSSIHRFTNGTSVHRWRTMDNPYLPKSYIDLLLQEYDGTDLYAQDLLGQFVQFKGLVYHPLPSAIVDYVPMGPWRRVFGGVDFGSTSVYAHATAAHVVAEDEAGRFWVVAEFYQRPARGFALEEWLAEMQAVWDVEYWEGDRSQFQAITMLAQAGIRIQPTPSYQEVSVLDGITIVQRRFAANGLFIVGPQCPNAVNELRSYQWKEPKPGAVAAREPVKIRDDAMDSLRYGVVALERAYHAPDSFDTIQVEWDSDDDFEEGEWVA